MKHLTRRRRPLSSLAGATLALAAGAALADSGKTIRLLVGFPAGGGTDAIARTLADKLRGELNTNVIVENKPGAGGQLAAQALRPRRPTARRCSSATTTRSASCRWW